VEKPARPVAVLAAQYRQYDKQSITLTAPRYPAEVAIRRKWFPPAVPTWRPRVLYVVWHYPQLSETYAETELVCMRNWGVHVEVWCTSAGASLYPFDVPVHRGSLAAAIEAARPDVIHVHWLGFANMRRDELAAAGLPVTVRAHGFDTTRDSLAAWLANDCAAAVFAFPGQIARCGIDDDRLKATPVAFDTRLFKPRPAKDRRLVVRTSSGLPSKDLACFFEAARMLPDYRFVLAAVTCQGAEAYADELRATHARMATPAELWFDVAREDVAELVSRAGIYLHTMHKDGHVAATPVGEPISVAEAMATGCHCLVRDVPELVAMLGDSGAVYRDVDELVGLIRATEAWSDADWHAAWQRGVEQAHRYHADVMVYRGMFSDWMALAGMRTSGRPEVHEEPSDVAAA
jgi:glycosyltransferase involved in cell wall biosynthesis